MMFDTNPCTIFVQNVIQYSWNDRARENAEEYLHFNIIQWRMKTLDRRWLLQKNQWEWIMMVVCKPLHPCGPVSRTTTSSFAIYTVVT
jgi:hypothetical protein